VREAVSLSNAAENDLRRIWREGKAERGEAQAKRLSRVRSVFPAAGRLPGDGAPLR
jgi:plasmid stabilization system protein ParE